MEGIFISNSDDKSGVLTSDHKLQAFRVLTWKQTTRWMVPVVGVGHEFFQRLLHRTSSSVAR